MSDMHPRLAAARASLGTVSPGAVQGQFVQASFVLAGDQASFDQYSFKANLATLLNARVGDISLYVTSGSILVHATIAVLGSGLEFLGIPAPERM